MPEAPLATAPGPRAGVPTGRLLSDALSAIERERYHSYSGLVRNFHWLSAALVALFGVIEGADALLVLSGVMAAYTLLFHYVEIPALSVHRKMQVEGWLDLLWVTAALLHSGAARSPLFFLYYLVLYTTTPTAERWQTYARAGVATALAALVSSVSRAQASAGAAAWWMNASEGLLWPLAGLWVVAYFSAESGTRGVSLQRSLFLAAHTDDLTGLANMRYFTHVADRRDRLGEPYAIVMVDADYLKRLNDAHGHARGSELICRVADALRHAARRGSDDVCSRLGGDEFIVRLAGADGTGGLAYCQRVRQYLEGHPLAVDGKTLPVSVSMGVAAHPVHGRTLAQVVRRADEALYRSKREGRGRDTLWSEERAAAA